MPVEPVGKVTNPIQKQLREKCERDPTVQTMPDDIRGPLVGRQFQQMVTSVLATVEYGVPAKVYIGGLIPHNNAHSSLAEVQSC